MELTIRNMSVVIENRTILAPLSLDMHSGEFIGIIGPNGSGKTTFLKALRRLYPLQSGEITLDGIPMDTLSEKEVASRIAYMQQQVAITFGYTVKDVVLTARYPYLSWWQNESEDDETIAEEAMKQVGVWHLRDRVITELSGGERQRVFLAKALAQRTNIVLLDEPTAALDLVYADDIFRRGKDLCEEGKLICVVVHDLELAAKYCSRLILLSDGHVVADGTAQQVLTAAHLQHAFHLSSAVYEDPYFQQRRIYIFPQGSESIEPYRREQALPTDISIKL